MTLVNGLVHVRVSVHTLTLLSYVIGKWWIYHLNFLKTLLNLSYLSMEALSSLFVSSTWYDACQWSVLNSYWLNEEWDQIPSLCDFCEVQRDLHIREHCHRDVFTVKGKTPGFRGTGVGRELARTTWEVTSERARAWLRSSYSPPDVF